MNTVNIHAGLMRRVDGWWAAITAAVIGICLWTGTQTAFGMLFLLGFVGLFLALGWAWLTKEALQRAHLLPVVEGLGPFILGLLLLHGWTIEDSLQVTLTCLGIGGALLWGRERLL